MPSWIDKLLRRSPPPVVVTDSRPAVAPDNSELDHKRRMRDRLVRSLYSNPAGKQRDSMSACIEALDAEVSALEGKP